jgi:hypothetical protein
MKSVEIQTEDLLMLMPGDIYEPKDSNSRYKLNPFEVRDLAEKILTSGRVNVPIEVEPTTPEEKKATNQDYKITFGYKRKAAVSLIHSEANGNKEALSILLPARVATPASLLDRTIKQISENRDRSQMTPMDECTAMHLMESQGATKQDIMNTFKVPGGKGKGRELKPCSYSYLKMTMGFAEFPKAIKELIASGDITKDGAYEFYAHKREDWQKIADKLIADRIAGEEKEAATDEKALAKERGLEEAKTTLETTKSELEKVEATAEAAVKAHTQLAKEEEAKLKLARSIKDPVKKKEAEAALAATTKAVALADAEARKAEKQAEALRKKQKAVAEKLEKALDAGKAKKTTNKKEVQAAAKAVGSTSKKAPSVSEDDDDDTPKLTVAQYEATIKRIAKPCGMPKADAILAALPGVIAGTFTVNQFQQLVRIHTGEEKAPVAKKVAK